MYDPSTLAFDLRMPWPGRPYGLSFISIWHQDPERPGTGNRTDDSCGWFDRSPGAYADAVAYLLNDKTTMHEVARALATRTPVTGEFGHTYPRMPLGDSLASVSLVAVELENRRWWNGQYGKPGVCHSPLRKALTKRRDVLGQATDLALRPLDNLSSVDEPETMVLLIAAALNRHYRPWWKHPRWHVHHWRIQFHPFLKPYRWLTRRCSRCGGMFGWNESPHGCWGGEAHWHARCDETSAYVADTRASVGGVSGAPSDIIQ